MTSDARFDSHFHRADYCQELIIILDELFATQPIKEWRRRVDDHACLWVPVQPLGQVVEDLQVHANNVTVPLSHEQEGTFRVVSTPIKFQSTPDQAHHAAPELGQDAEMVLLELGYSWEGSSALRDQGAVIG